MPTISVIFSFRNEEKVLPELLRRNIAALSGQPEDYELVFVNDDSSDRSIEILRQQRQSNPRIKAINMSRRFGVYECLMAGMAHASGDAVIYMDSDLQDPPELIPQMLERWRQGADVVHTVRRKRNEGSWFRMWITRQAYRVLAWFSGEIHLPVEAGDFKLLSRRAVNHVLQLRESDPYFRGLAVWVGFNQQAIEYEREARAAGRSQRGLLTAGPWEVFLAGLTSFSFLPIYVVLGFGAVGSLVVALGAAVAGILRGVGSGVGFHFWLVILILFCWTSVLFAVGILGLYLIRIYKDVRGRPSYIVKDTIGLESVAHLAAK